jgi:GntP family gluconate:H+ symporter
MDRRKVLTGLMLLVVSGTWLFATFSHPPSPAAAQTSTSTVEDAPSPSAGGARLSRDHQWSLLVLAIGIATVLGLIIAFKINAFLALIIAAIVVSVLSPAIPLAEKISRVAAEFGISAGKIGIVIAAAAVIGKCMLDSGAADRIVRAFLHLLGEKRAPVALMASGYTLAIPVFFDTVFYLLVPLARSLYRKTGKNYLCYIMAIAAGGAITHTLVPPTPGPLAMAEYLKIDVGMMIVVGAAVALPSAIVGLIVGKLLDRRMPLPMRAVPGMVEPKPLSDEELPPLWASLLPIVLPVLLITSNTVLSSLAKPHLQEIVRLQTAGDDAAAEVVSTAHRTLLTANEYSAVFGNAGFALLLSTIAALVMVIVQRKLSRNETAELVEISLMSGGLIIMITAAGGAFGKMLELAQVGDAIKAVFAIDDNAKGAGITFLLLGFGIAAVLKIAQGSSTVAMITCSGMLASIGTAATLGFHPVYLATSIGAGSLIGSWMNDSGFWIVAKMSGMTEVEALKSWTVLLLVLGCTSFLLSIVLSMLLPLT